MGVSDMLVQLVKGYFQNQQMCTKFNGLVSPVKTLTCGVPQGLVIGPILFLCYINDIVNVVSDHNTRAVLYADDTVIYSASTDMSSLKNSLQETLDSISLWCYINGIKLKVGKTKLCFYGTRHNLGASLTYV